MSRMKDSDDYLTARAANPWTGLISPSPGTQTPCTPDSPAEALSLRIRTTQQESPTHAVKRRPILAKANEGRKVSSANARVTAVGNTNHGTSQYTNSGQVPDDRFIVHMPSAREPQPFAYPGYTADQIAALEHYKVKSRRVSSEGYDRRLFHDKPAADCSTRHDHAGALHNCADPSHRPFTPYQADHHHDHEPSTPEPPRLFVRKRENSKISRILHRGQEAQDQAPANTNTIAEGRSSPVLGPRSPKPSSSSSTTKDRAAVDNQHSNNNNNNVSTKSRKSAKHAEKVSASDTGKAVLTHMKVCSNKPMKDSAPRRGADDHDQGSACGNRSEVSLTAAAAAAITPPDMRSTSWDIASLPGAFMDLSQLPRVQLVKPEHAAVPRGVTVRRTGQKTRKCSLGCERDEQNGACVQRRVTSSGTVIRSTSSFERTAPVKKREKDAPVDYTEHALTYTLLCLQYLGSLQLPRVGLLQILQNSELSTKDKTEALKAMLSLAGHALAVCILLAIVWKLGTSVVILSQVIFWPLAVPLRVVMWVMIG